jgi:predicted Ser/Thr protein kinase
MFAKKFITRISQSTTECISAVCATTFLTTKIIKKPKIAKKWIATAHAAQIVLMLTVLLMPRYIPNIADDIINKMSPPTISERFSGFLKQFQDEPRLTQRQYTTRIVLWSASISIILLLLWIHIPKAVRITKKLASNHEKEADILINSTPTESILLYRLALSLIIDPIQEESLRNKIKSIDNKLADNATLHTKSTHPQNKSTVVETTRNATDKTVVEQTESQDINANSKIVLSRYKVETQLGQGAMGTVFLAHDEKLRRNIALKQLAPELGTNKQFVSRFRQEARALAKLSHLNIIQIYDFIEDDNMVWIAMEYVNGQELNQLLEENTELGLKDVILLTTQICDALDHAHSQGVIHRDFKPSNVLVTNENIVKVMDFGLAKISQSEQLTQIGKVMGTPAYMSPEQAAGNAIDERTDIYSLGIVLYRMLSGSIPFKGDVKSVIAQHLTHTPVSLTKLKPEIPKKLNKLVLQMLSKSPDDRPINIKEVRNALLVLNSNKLAWN